jgi:hypothetical protein
VESTITKQGVRNLNSLGPQRPRPPRDDKPRKQPDAETVASAPASAPAPASDETVTTPAPAADKS